MDTTAVDDRLGKILGSRYRLVALIGAGGSARVYLADDVRLRRQVAVKILHASLAGESMFLRRFAAEAQAAAAIAHPHLLTVHDWGESDEGPYLVTEYLSGGSLRSMLDGAGTITAAQAVKIGLEAAAGLAAAHARGMVHRDIKPANLLFDHTGRLRIADFGIVQALNEAAVTEPAGVLVGTASYAAPERATTAAIDGRTDVYSLTLTLVEAVTGAVPLSTGDLADTMALRQQRDLEIPDDFGTAREVLLEAGRRDPSQRPHSIDLRDRLVEATSGFQAPSAFPLAGAIPGGAPPYQGDATAHLSDDAAEVIHSTSTKPPASADTDAQVRPRWRSTWRLVALLALLVVAATVAAALLVSDVQPKGTPTHVVEPLTGRPIAEVRESVDGLWILDEDQVRSDSVEAGVVLSQRPVAGSELAEGELLSVEVASGPLLVLTPRLNGMSAGAAVERLTARGFVVDTQLRRFDEVVPEDEVMEVSIEGDIIAGGRLREPGTALTLVVSGGPVPRVVPSLVGLTLEEASEALEEIQLELVEASERVFSETVPEGTVVGQDVGAGFETARGSRIEVTVSKGPDRRIVPDLTGMTIGEATAALEAVGLVRSGVSGSGDIVTATDPVAGKELRPGEEVLLFAPGR